MPIVLIKTKSSIGMAHRPIQRALLMHRMHTLRTLPDNPTHQGAVRKIGRVVAWTRVSHTDLPSCRHLCPPRRGYPSKIARTGYLSPQDFQILLRHYRL